MLTSNKAVYGTDGSLKTLKDMGGGDGGRKHLPVFQSERIENTEHYIYHSWDIDTDTDNFSFDDHKYDDCIFLIFADVTLHGDTSQVCGVLPPYRLMTGSNFIYGGKLGHGLSCTFDCDGSYLGFTVTRENEEVESYIDDFQITIYLV